MPTAGYVPQQLSAAGIYNSIGIFESRLGINAVTLLALETFRKK